MAVTDLSTAPQGNASADSVNHVETGSETERLDLLTGIRTVVADYLVRRLENREARTKLNQNGVVVVDLTYGALGLYSPDSSPLIVPVRVGMEDFQEGNTTVIAGAGLLPVQPFTPAWRYENYPNRRFDMFLPIGFTNIPNTIPNLPYDYPTAALPHGIVISEDLLMGKRKEFSISLFGFAGSQMNQSLLAIFANAQKRHGVGDFAVEYLWARYCSGGSNDSNDSNDVVGYTLAGLAVADNGISKLNRGIRSDLSISNEGLNSIYHVLTTSCTNKQP